MNELTTLTKGTVYRLKSQLIGGVPYPDMYKRGEFIHVRVLSDPSRGLYRATARDEEGKPLGPGGFPGDKDLLIKASQVEDIPSEV